MKEMSLFQLFCSISLSIKDLIIHLILVGRGGIPFELELILGLYDSSSIGLFFLFFFTRQYHHLLIICTNFCSFYVYFSLSRYRNSKCRIGQSLPDFSVLITHISAHFNSHLKLNILLLFATHLNSIHYSNV